MKVAYLDCFSGISGDMFVGALLDTGLSLDLLKRALRTLPLGGYELAMAREARNHVYGCRFRVQVNKEEQVPRGLSEIRRIISEGDLSPSVKERAQQVFEEIAKAEGKIHNRPAEQVHFHEIGAVDSIVDIVGTVFGLEALGIDALFVSPLPLGSGFIKTAHGSLPNPAPATLELLKGAPVVPADCLFELVTPTGAALVKVLAKAFGPLPEMKIRAVGYGVGSRDLGDRPNLTRLLIGDPASGEESDTVVILETHVDDCMGEVLGYLMERLFEAGALDVVFSPVQMKKNRPGVHIQVIGRPESKETLIEILFQESTTLGVRFHYSQRKVLNRVQEEVETPWGKVWIKRVLDGERAGHFSPEYESCRTIALQQKVPVRVIMDYVNGLNPPLKGS